MMTFTLEMLPDTFGICRLDADAPIPDWAQGNLVSITRTALELSIVCRQDCLPGSVKCDAGWRCLRVAGTLDFSLVGVIASLTGTLADAGISVFVVSTFDTDFVLIKDQELRKAVDELKKAGHQIGEDE